ncbi:MAG: hypothetical protein ABGX03_07030 [Methylophilaceae bacterium]
MSNHGIRCSVKTQLQQRLQMLREPVVLDESLDDSVCNRGA